MSIEGLDSECTSHHQIHLRLHRRQVANIQPGQHAMETEKEYYEAILGWTDMLEKTWRRLED